jgi:hypothetical protein
MSYTTSYYYYTIRHACMGYNKYIHAIYEVIASLNMCTYFYDTFQECTYFYKKFSYQYE